MMSKFKINEFRPTILFLSKFILMYLVANVLYGLYVSSFRKRPDPITSVIAAQTSMCLNVLGHNTSWIENTDKPTTQINQGMRPILLVYEGCNGINVMVIFLAFIIAFGPFDRTMIWFIPLGLTLLHLANLVRLILLFEVTTKIPTYFYFVHKYFFTAAIYLVVLLLWVWWVRMAIRKQIR